MIEEKFPEVGVLLKAGREKGYILYEEIHTILSDEATAAPKDLEGIYARFFEVGIEIVTDPDRAARRRAAEAAETADEAREAVDRLAAAISDDFVLGEIMLLRMRAALSCAQGDDVAYRDSSIAIAPWRNHVDSRDT